MPDGRIYIAIDLKSFYASVECVARGLDPLTTNLVVADQSRTEKTICLAVSPSLKAYGISGRARLFEVVQRVKEVNAQRQQRAPGRAFTGSSCQAPELAASPGLALDYLVAKPRMAHYIKASTDIYQIYLKYVSAEDIHVYSIDEVFMDVTDYLHTYGLTPAELARKIDAGCAAQHGHHRHRRHRKQSVSLQDCHGYLGQAHPRGCRRRADCRAGRAELPAAALGPPAADRLLARAARATPGSWKPTVCSPWAILPVRSTWEHNEASLYRLFGINAELLIDHAWGWEPCTIADVKSYRPGSSSLGSGQVLQTPLSLRQGPAGHPGDGRFAGAGAGGQGAGHRPDYPHHRLRRDKSGPRAGHYQGDVVTDRYGRRLPKHAHGTANLARHTASTRLILQAAGAALRPHCRPRAADSAAEHHREPHLYEEASLPRDSGMQLDFFSGEDAARDGGRSWPGNAGCSRPC